MIIAEESGARRTNERKARRRAWQTFAAAAACSAGFSSAARLVGVGADTDMLAG